MNPRTLTALALSLVLFSASALACSQDKSGHDGQNDHKKHLVRQVISAVSQTGLSAEQAKAVTDAVNTFKMKRMQQKAARSFPVDAFENDAFNAERFTQTTQRQFDEKNAAMVELFTALYGILTPEQRPLFKRAFTAPMVEKMIKKNMVKGHMMPEFKTKSGCGGK